MVKVVKERMTEKMKSLGYDICADLAYLHLKDYMRHREGNFSIGDSYAYESAPSYLKDAVLCWLYGIEADAKHPDKTEKMLLEFVDLYGDVYMDGSLISLEFSIPKDRKSVDTFVKISGDLLKAFEKEHATEITEYQVKERNSEAFLETFFADKAKNNDGEAE